MRMPGFNADASLYVSGRSYGGRPQAMPATGTFEPAISGSYFPICVGLCMENGGSYAECWILCAAAEGLIEYFEDAGLAAAGGAAAGGAAAEGGAAAGGTAAGGGTAVGGAILWPLAVIAGAVWWTAWKVYVAKHPGPVTGPAAASGPPCGAVLKATPPPAKGWGADAAHLTKSGCEVAIDEALQNAANYCSTLNAYCTGGCTTGKCLSLPIVDDVSNQTHLFWCGARVHYRCGCFCV